MRFTRRLRSSLLFATTRLMLLAAVACGAPAAAATSGRAVPPAWTDLSGKRYSAAEVAHRKATVFIFISSQCPIAGLYTPRINELGRDYATKGVALFVIDSNPEDSPASLKRYARERGVTLPMVKDRGTELADRLGASRTPEAVLLDQMGEVRYRGRIDDNADRSKVVRRDLREALDAVLAGKPVVRSRMLAFGCAIFRESAKPVATSTAITYVRDVAPILDRNCVICHRQGEAAPFALQTYQQARTWAAAVRDYTSRRIMPPWHASPGFGEFRDAAVLTDKEIAVLAKWAASGTPEGDPKLRPALPTFPAPGAWRLGRPDLVLHAARDYHLGPEGTDVYREFVLPLDLNEDRYLSAIEFKPDNRAVVHHMIAYLDPTGQSAKKDGKESEPGYSVEGSGIGTQGAEFLAGWAPGNTSRFLPPGAAFKLNKGGKLVLQVHYHRDGKLEADHSTIGLYFAKGTVEQEIRVSGAFQFHLNLLPNQVSQPVVAETPVISDAHIWSVFPHMHMLGRQMKMWAELPDGKTVPMIWIKDWDFNWQESYNYKQPLFLPKGSKIKLEAVFDNTENNPHQPSLPPKLVHWGEQTTDEMCIGFFSFTMDNEHLNLPAKKQEVGRKE